MTTIVSENVFGFVGGLFFGILATLLWNKIFEVKKSEQKSSQRNLEYDYVPQSFLGSEKLVLVVRNDLKMGKGKVAAQCSHAAVMAHEAARTNYPEIFRNWKKNGQPKIVVKIDGEEEMLELAKQAENCGLLVRIVTDAGRTQIAPGSRTVLAVGPGPDSVVSQVTGHLKLY